MTTPSIFKTAYRVVRRPLAAIALCVVAILACAGYPTDLSSYPLAPAGTPTSATVRLTEDYLRFIPTVLQIAVPIVLGDKVGLVQLAYLGIANTVATQGLKFAINGVTVGHTRIGERPRGGNHNMPSGHSSMSSCAAVFLGRRYGWKYGAILGVLTLMTMYARVMLNAHTVSAVLAGALIGIATTLWFTSPRRKDADGVKQG
jgi:membrane-associated phospholipid phosphatase